VPGPARNCEAERRLLFSVIVMIDTYWQVPSPAATAWLLDLTAKGGPLLVVLRREHSAARAAAVGHLLDAGITVDAAQARELVADVDPQLVAVTW
jgi:hypothetical protein